MPCESGDSDRGGGRRGRRCARLAERAALSSRVIPARQPVRERGMGRRPGGASFLGTEAREGAVKAPALLVTFGKGYLVDPASSHMLVSKIKPCMSKYKRAFVPSKLRMAQ
ncbi:hypothetical protein CLOP_g15948 [Closterium sp. NIES-67]|nr:hypothetical protein CLOP_g4390 [Closterium sp. NIES-67]GJP85854.1 hypothetical protein CLOP_g15948 [Closterium sp. NIES-67]